MDLEREYRIDIDFEPGPYVTARRLRARDERDPRFFMKLYGESVLRARDERAAFLPTSPRELDNETRNNERIEFLNTKELD